MQSVKNSTAVKQTSISSARADKLSAATAGSPTIKIRRRR